MISSAAHTNAVHDIETICFQDNDSRELRGQVAARLARLVNWDASCFATMDPWTLLLTDDVSDRIPPDFYPLAARNEYLMDDVHTFSTLATTGPRVAILSPAPREKSRPTGRLEPGGTIFGAEQEIRAACVVDGQCWGGIAMFRNSERSGFSTDEAALLQAISVPLAAGLRRAALRPGAVVGAISEKDGPGVMILGPHNEVVVTNDAARRWMDKLAPSSGESSIPLPLAVHQVAERARAHVFSLDDESARLAEACCRVRTRSGQWLTIRASPVDDDLFTGKGVAVVIDAASASDIAQILMLAHGLTRRERQVLQRVIAGAPSAGIASQLSISVNTVQDHLKAIFAKVGVRSRGQLVAQLLHQHHPPGD